MSAHWCRDRPLYPALGSGQPLAPTTRLVMPPDAYRVDAPDLGDWFADQIQQQIDDMAAHGIKFAGFLADSIFSSDGVLPDPRGFLKKAVEVVHANGGIFIADEVQPGFGRTSRPGQARPHDTHPVASPAAWWAPAAVHCPAPDVYVHRIGS